MPMTHAFILPALLSFSSEETQSNHHHSEKPHTTPDIHTVKHATGVLGYHATRTLSHAHLIARGCVPSLHDVEDRTVYHGRRSVVVHM